MPELLFTVVEFCGSVVNMENTKNKIWVSVRLDRLNHSPVHDMAQSNGISFSDALNEALTQWRVAKALKKLR